MLRTTALLLLVGVCPALFAKDWTPAPALADPAGTTRVIVSNNSQLQTAISNIQSNQLIVLAAGTYTLASTLWLGGSAALSNIGIRGATGNPSDVTVQGNGMTGNIPHGIWVGDVNGILIADLTIQSVANHPVQVTVDCNAPHFYNCRLRDSGEQLIKGSSGGSWGTGCDNGIVEYCHFSYTTQGTTYTNGVDVHGGDNWIIRHCRFERVNLIPGGIGPAVLMWNGSTNTICEGCTFINCECAIAFGLVDRTAPQYDHSGGVIRNNFIWRASGTPAGVDTPDCSILVWDSPNTKVLNNTVLQNGSYASGIEYRFHTTGAEIRYNLLDCSILDRGSGTSGNTIAGNVTNAQAAWFVNPAQGNLRLSSSAPASVIDAAATHADVNDDYDGNTRGTAPDIGAHEYNGQPTAPSAPTGCNATSLGNLEIRVGWSDASTNEDGFRIERAVGQSAFLTLTTVGAGTTAHTDTGLTEGQEYRYRVVAYNAVGDSASSNTASATAATAPPAGGSGGQGGKSGGGGGCSLPAGSSPLAVLGLMAATIFARCKFPSPGGRAKTGA